MLNGEKKNPNTIQNRKKSQEEYRHRVRRFTFQFSLRDLEAREWLEQQPKKGDYLIHTLESAASIGLGSRNYQLVLLEA